MLRTTLTALTIAAFTAAPAAAHPTTPTLKARAILPADATWPAPFPAAPNTEPAPAPGSVQPVGGFSALLRGPHGSYLAMPDNGFGSKANSHSFLRSTGLRGQARLERRATSVSSARSACATRITRSRSSSSTTPRRSAISPAATSTSSRSASIADGTLWFGDEFGPFLRPHRRRPARCSRRRSRCPACVSPDYPRTSRPRRPRRTSPRSNGFEGMAISPGRPDALPDARGPAGRRRPARRSAASYTFDIAKRPLQPASAGLPRRRSRATLVSDLDRAGRRPLRRRSSATTSRARRRSTSRRSSIDVPDGDRAGDARGARRARHRRPGRDLAAGPGAPRRLRPRRPVRDALPDDRGRAAAVAATSSRSSTTRTSARRAATRRCRTTATSSACGCQGPSSQRLKLISPHSWREWSSRRATCSSISRATAAGSK